MRSVESSFGSDNDSEALDRGVMEVEGHVSGAAGGEGQIVMTESAPARLGGLARVESSAIPSAKKALRALVHREDPDVLYLMETKVNSSRMNGIWRGLGFGGASVSDSLGTTGGACLCWKVGVDIQEEKFGGRVVEENDGQDLNDFVGCYGWSGLGLCCEFLHLVGVRSLAIKDSNHAPLVLDLLLDRERYRTLFQYLDAWSRDKTCKEVIKQAWAIEVCGSRSWQLVARLDNTRRCLSKWYKTHFGMCEEKLRILNNLLIEIQGRIPSKANLKLEADIILEIDEFFHGTTVIKRKRNFIAVVCVDGNSWLEGRQHIRDYFRSNFMSVLSSTSPAAPNLTGLIFSGVSAKANQALIRKPMEKEIKEVVWAMPPLKAPGPDGMPGKFFKDHWDIVGKGVVAAIISKLLANRLRTLLKDLISPFQSAFVPGRWIAENSIMAHEVLDSFKKLKGREGKVFSRMLLEKEVEGLITGFKKLAYTFFGNTARDTQLEIVDRLEFHKLGIEDKFLGNPIIWSKSTVKDFKFLKAKILSKIEGWRCKLLSQAGRATLIRTVAQSVPIYSMSSFLLPKVLCRELDQVIRKFWWIGGGDKDRYLALVEWDALCLPVDRGGLNFKKFEDINLALLTKLGWKLASGESSLWCTAFKEKYWGMSFHSFWSFMLPRNASFGARGPTSLKVSSLLNAEGEWDSQGPYRWLVPSVASSLHLVKRLPSSQQDLLVWKDATDGVFSPKIKITERLKLFLWKLGRDVLPFGNLLQRILGNPVNCVLYGDNVDYWLHLFCHCPLAKATWFGSQWAIRGENLNFSCLRDFVLWLLDPGFLRGASKEDREAFSRFGICLCDELWNARNRAFHDQVFSTCMGVIARVNSACSTMVGAWEAPALPHSQFCWENGMDRINGRRAVFVDAACKDLCSTAGLEPGCFCNELLIAGERNSWPFCSKLAIGEVVLAPARGRGSGDFEACCGDANIVLIPKNKNPEDMTQLRPIALCNVVYKIIMKVSVNRMKSFMDCIVADTQSASIPGHLISDNVLISFEVLHYLKMKRKGKEGFMALKLDMSKAYDKIECNFLEAMLCLPSTMSRNKLAVLGFLKERVQKRIQGWESKFLRRAGKEVLIKTVAQSLPIYAMSVFLLPLDITHDMERLMSKFWWQSFGNTWKGIHWESWSQLFVHKAKSGMGFRHLRDFNLSLLGKQGWRLISRPDSLVAKVLKARYFPNGSYLNSSLGNNSSFVWCSVWEAQQLVFKGVHWCVENGRDIKAAHDPWVPCNDNPFIISSHPNLLNAIVHNLMRMDGEGWDVELLEDMFEARDIELIRSIPLLPSLDKDSLTWCYETSCLYSQWSAPNENSIKINVDAALFEGGNNYGIGLVARNHHGFLVEGQTDYFLRAATIELAEAIGVRKVGPKNTSGNKSY
uniref:Reverse transcriptase n=1 Tax=Cannabis sativa TaxID=3483 RepID=A0A803NJK8_CANSA